MSNLLPDEEDPNPESMEWVRRPLLDRIAELAEIGSAYAARIAELEAERNRYATRRDALDRIATLAALLRGSVELLSEVRDQRNFVSLREVKMDGSSLGQRIDTHCYYADAALGGTKLSNIPVGYWQARAELAEARCGAKDARIAELEAVLDMWADRETPE